MRAARRPHDSPPPGPNPNGKAPSRRGVWTLTLGIAALSLGAALWWPRGVAVHPGSAPEQALSVKANGPVPARAARSEVAPRKAGSDPAPPLPASLQGTSVDGALDVDVGGHLVIGPRVIELFDYFFAATGEESDAAIRARISSYSKQHLREPALGEALRLLDSYVAYRGAASMLRAEDAKGPSERLAALRELRVQHFGDAAGALFGKEERETEAAIAKVAAAKDPSLSREDRADRFADADELAGAAAKEARAAMTRVQTFREDEATLRAQGEGDEEIERFRAGVLGEEAAARLGDLDRRRAAFRERLEAFRHERDTRCGSAADSKCEADLLAASSFDEAERIRVRVLLSAPTN